MISDESKAIPRALYWWGTSSRQRYHPGWQRLFLNHRFRNTLCPEEKAEHTYSPLLYPSLHLTSSKFEFWYPLTTTTQSRGNRVSSSSPPRLQNLILHSQNPNQMKCYKHCWSLCPSPLSALNSCSNLDSHTHPFREWCCPRRRRLANLLVSRRETSSVAGTGNCPCILS